jgi:hypothetical protein
VDVTKNQAPATLTTEGPDGAGAIAMGTWDNTFTDITDTRNLVLSLTSPLALLYATTLRKNRIHLMPDSMNPRFLRIYRVPRPET